MKKPAMFVAFGCLMTACGSGGGGHVGGGGFNPVPPGPSPTSSPTQTPAPSTGTIYVGGEAGGQYVVKAYDSNGNAKSTSGFSGLSTYPALKYDATDGLLYTPNSVSGGGWTMLAFTPEGVLQTLPGSWAGMTNSSGDIAYDSHDGLFYVPNYSNGAYTMLAYDANGNPQSQSPTAWSGLRDPYAIAFDAHNNLFYTSYAGGVQIWDENGDNVTPAGAFGNLPTASNVTVQGLLYDPHNNTIYVIESNSTAITYDESGNTKSQMTWTEALFPARMAFDPDNNLIYVINLEAGAPRVVAFDESGNVQPLGNWSGVGVPSSIAVVP